MEFDNNLPIYIQIMYYIKKQIVTGQLKEGDKIPSVRELATELQINPNTVQRTFQELEREGIVETKRGMGRYVTKERGKIMDIKREMSKELIQTFLKGMYSLGFTKEEIINVITGAVENNQSRERE
ncbi:GntR family transcriptional regulator [Priestia taiwanensis]|uniref:GntR family transcriptional regulator n=1 Tax=Priestia taiwanensis TaxID=1347902 RepID=A0A917ERD7_9BACI|nr:GntR family transcriptional regulator [Priestia taiwanensis]GGE76772.1 GntR family transcriptional regulator [Priestia taiwanensis]